MKTNAAVLWEIDGDWQIEEVDLDGPKEGEVRSSSRPPAVPPDQHVRTGDLAGVPPPIIGGHEGAGIVQGDRAGRARPQARRSRGDVVPAGLRALPVVRQDAEPLRSGRVDPRRHPDRWHLSPQGQGPRRGHVGRGRQLLAVRHAFGCVGGQDRRRSAVESRMPAGLRGDDWLGSAVNTADIRPGDTVVVIGFGGIGSGAVQGARLAGAERIIVVEPVESSATRLSSSVPPTS